MQYTACTLTVSDCDASCYSFLIHQLQATQDDKQCMYEACRQPLINVSVDMPLHTLPYTICTGQQTALMLLQSRIVGRHALLHGCHPPLPHHPD
jgi:hypothetical protein